MAWERGNCLSWRRVTVISLIVFTLAWLTCHGLIQATRPRPSLRILPAPGLSDWIQLLLEWWWRQCAWSVALVFANSFVLLRACGLVTVLRNPKAVYRHLLLTLVVATTVLAVAVAYQNNSILVGFVAILAATVIGGGLISTVNLILFCPILICWHGWQAGVVRSIHLDVVKLRVTIADRCPTGVEPP